MKLLEIREETKSPRRCLVADECSLVQVPHWDAESNSFGAVLYSPCGLTTSDGVEIWMRVDTFTKH